MAAATGQAVCGRFDDNYGVVRLDVETGAGSTERGRRFAVLGPEASTEGEAFADDPWASVPCVVVRIVTLRANARRFAVGQTAATDVGTFIARADVLAAPVAVAPFACAALHDHWLARAVDRAHFAAFTAAARVAREAADAYSRFAIDDAALVAAFAPVHALNRLA